MIKRVEDIVNDEEIDAILARACEIFRDDNTTMYGDAGPPGRLWEQYEAVRWLMVAIMYDVEYNLNMYNDATIISDTLINDDNTKEICRDEIAIARFYLKRACYDIANKSKGEWATTPVVKYYKKFIMR